MELYRADYGFRDDGVCLKSHWSVGHPAKAVIGGKHDLLGGMCQAGLSVSLYF